MRLALLVLGLASPFLALGIPESVPAAAPVPEGSDADRDGLPDAFEQALLERFAPTFMIDPEDCDRLPAEFLAGRTEPRVAARNGTIYGQVFPHRAADRGGGRVEVHYYHLWARDCGRIGHALDVEHVAALVGAGGTTALATAAGWRALYWYAAAHQDTPCDAGSGARASALGAEDRGATIWVSSGKHASFLTLDRCRRWGCGGDRCERSVPLQPGRLVNLGEPRQPLNGAVWTSSGNWPLAARMGSDFDAATLATLERLDDRAVASVRPVPPPVPAVILAGDTTLDAMAVGDRETRAAVATAGGRTDRALDRTAAGVGRSLRRAVRAVGGWLGAGRDATAAAP